MTVFDVADITDGENAIHVLGQDDFTSSGYGTSQTQIRNPYNLAYDPADDVLFVADFINNRVVTFDTSDITDGMEMSHVLGQPDFTSSAGGTTQTSTFGPTGLGHDPASGTLFVGQLFSHRVTYFKGITTPLDPTTSETTEPSTTAPSSSGPSTTSPGEEYPNNGDGNGDGIVDIEQPNVHALRNPISGGWVVFVTPESCTEEHLNVVSHASLSTQDSLSYPLGLLDFAIECTTPGVTVTVEHYYYGSKYKANNFIPRKFTTYDKQFHTLEGASVTNQNIGGQSVVKLVYSLTDGSTFDNDQTLNGIIVDPAGLALRRGSLAASGTESMNNAMFALMLIGIGICMTVTRSRKAALLG